MTRTGFILLCAACVFVIGNIVILYKFVGKPRLEKYDEGRIVKDFGHHFFPKKDSELLHNLAEQRRKGILESGTGNHQAAETTSLKLISRTDNTDAHNNEVANNQQVQQSKLDIRGSESNEAYTIAVLVIACNRPTVQRCLDQLLKYRPSSERFPIVVSQDCGHAETADVIRSYGSKVTLIEQPDLSDVQGVPGNMHQFMGYYKISRHYRWALGQVFDKMGYDSVLIVEDDLDIGEYLWDFY